MDSIIRKYIENHKDHDFFFVQIGANDGLNGDPIHNYVMEFRWLGILIEPVSFLFKKLQETYKGVQGLIFENKAISDVDGVRSFYRITRKTEPEKAYWFDQLGSFNKAVVESHWNNIPEQDKELVEEHVYTMRFSTLLHKYNIEKIDLLHIDTEGYDFEIIKMIPFEMIKPAMILYEHRHLSLEDKQASEALLKKQGYTVLSMEFDIFAFISY